MNQLPMRLLRNDVSLALIYKVRPEACEMEAGTARQLVELNHWITALNDALEDREQKVFTRDEVRALKVAREEMTR
jgi:hypothetical protein